jgi:sugar phosphate isomerase/epimerase
MTRGDASSTRPLVPGLLILAAGSMLDQPADVVVDAAAACGFDGVGLRVSHDHAVTEPGAIRRRAESAGLVVHDTEVHRISLDETDPTALIERSAALGASALLAVSDLADHRATLERVGDLTRRCEESGLRLALEYMAWTTPSEPAGAIEIARATGCVLVVDLLHHVRVGAGVAELRAVVESGTLGWVQICDAPLASPPHDRLVHEARHGRMSPGRGGLPLTDLLACLPDGVTVSVEVQNDALLDVKPFERARLLHDGARSVLSA